MITISDQRVYRARLIASFALAASFPLALALSVYALPAVGWPAITHLTTALGLWAIFGPLMWLIFSIQVVAIHRKRGLWVLMGAPFAALPVVAYIWLLGACARDGVCL